MARSRTKTQPIGRLDRQVMTVGLTLVELVVSLTLGAMMMAALVGVMRVASSQLRLAQKADASQWQQDCITAIERDLLLTSRIAMANGWLQLEGSFPNSSDNQPHLKLVRYGCTPWIDERSALVRRTGEGTDLLCIGPRRILCERLDTHGFPQPLSATPISVPERVRIWMWTQSLDTPEAVYDVAIR